MAIDRAAGKQKAVFSGADRGRIIPCPVACSDRFKSVGNTIALQRDAAELRSHLFLHVGGSDRITAGRRDGAEQLRHAGHRSDRNQSRRRGAEHERHGRAIARRSSRARRACVSQYRRGRHAQFLLEEQLEGAIGPSSRQSVFSRRAGSLWLERSLSGGLLEARLAAPVSWAQWNCEARDESGLRRRIPRLGQRLRNSWRRRCRSPRRHCPGPGDGQFCLADSRNRPQCQSQSSTSSDSTAWALPAPIRGI